MRDSPRLGRVGKPATAGSRDREAGRWTSRAPRRCSPPFLASTPGTRYQTAAANAGRRFDQIAAAVKDYLWACIGSGPALLLFEDIHWYDEDTVELVNSLPGRRPPGPAGRSSPVDRFPHSTMRQRPSSCSPSPTNTPISSSAPCIPSCTETARKAVQERCDGIPLFIEEVVAKLRQNASRSRRLRPRSPTPCTKLWSRGCVRAPTHCWSVETAALIGSRFDRDLLSTVIRRARRREIDSLLDELTGPGCSAEWAHAQLERSTTSFCARSPPNCPRRASAGACTTASPTRWPAKRSTAPRTGRWWRITSRTPTGSTMPRRPISGPRRKPVSAGRSSRLATISREALENIELLPVSQGPRSPRGHTSGSSAGFLRRPLPATRVTEAAAEFERCLQLVGEEPSLDCFATFSALWGYYTCPRPARSGDERWSRRCGNWRAHPIGPRAAYNAVAGFLADVPWRVRRRAREALEAAAAALDRHGVTADRTDLVHAERSASPACTPKLGFVRFLQGDLAGAEPAFARIAEQMRGTDLPR